MGRQINHISLEKVEVDSEKLPKAIRDAIERQGEVSFLRRLSRLIRKHTKIEVDWEKKQVRVIIGGVQILELK